MAKGDGLEMRLGPLAGAVAAVGAGCALQASIGAPPRMILVNGAALLVGMVGVILIAICRRAGTSGRAGDLTLLGAAALLPLTALAGPATSGVARWLVIGGLTVQPAMIVVPVIAVSMALHSSAMRAAAAVIAALGLAIQPDPGGAAILTLGLVAPLLVMERRHAIDLVGPVAAAVSLAVAQARAVPLPPAPFVEHVFSDALRAGWLPTGLVLAAAMLMVSPALVRPLREPQLAFLGTWVAALTAALLGPYPTPVIGFGGSGVLGYVLSAGLLALGLRPLRHR